MINNNTAMSNTAVYKRITAFNTGDNIPYDIREQIVIFHEDMVKFQKYTDKASYKISKISDILKREERRREISQLQYEHYQMLDNDFDAKLIERRNRKRAASDQLEILLEPLYKQKMFLLSSGSVIDSEEKEEEVEEPEFMTIHYGTEKEVLKEMAEAMREQSRRNKKKKTKIGCFPSFSMFNFAKSSKRVELTSKSMRKRGFSFRQKKSKGEVFV